jgi:hypothetical protein
MLFDHEQHGVGILSRVHASRREWGRHEGSHFLADRASLKPAKLGAGRLPSIPQVPETAPPMPASSGWRKLERGYCGVGTVTFG